jgi:tyrosine-protein kinase
VTPHKVLDVVRERWRFLVAGLLLGVVAAGIAIYLVPREYSASVTMIVSTQSVDPTSQVSASDEISQQRISTYVELMGSRRLASDVILAQRLPETPEQLAARITVTTTPDSALITATVTDSSPGQAVNLANAIGAAFIKGVGDLEQPVDPTRRPPVVAKVFQAAQPPADLAAPRPLLYLAFGVVLGLLVGFGAAMLRSVLDTRVTSRSQLEEILGVPVLGTIGRDRKIRSSPLRMYGASHAALAEAFRYLRTNIQVAVVDHQRKTVLVTSATSAEGRTTTVCNLGLTLAKAGARVVIVDADLRNPAIARYLGIATTPGLSDVLNTRESMKTAVRPVGPSLDALPSGLCPPNPSELLGSKRMTELLASLREMYDVVLIDSAPLLPVTDAAVLAPRVDAVLVVVRQGRTRVQDLYAARETLQAVSGRILGSVLTMARHAGPRMRSRLTPTVGRWWPTARQSGNGTHGPATMPTAAPRPMPQPMSRADPRPSPRPRVDDGGKDDGPPERSDLDETLDRGPAAR